MLMQSHKLIIATVTVIQYDYDGNVIFFLILNHHYTFKVFKSCSTSYLMGEE